MTRLFATSLIAASMAEAVRDINSVCAKYGEILLDRGVLDPNQQKALLAEVIDRCHAASVESYDIMMRCKTETGEQ